VSQGVTHACAISSADQLYCWGRKEEIGVNATSDALAPTLVDATKVWSSISASRDRSCGISKGQVYCWQSGAPSLVSPLSDWSEVAAWKDSACAIRVGALYCWGNNYEGKLGIPSANERVENPALVDDGSLSPWQKVSIAEAHACGIRGDGSLWCWGSNRWGEAGTGPSWSHEPLAVVFQ
jgi:alpha-tubulin suppressor-like RCC1 family protein